MACLQVTASKLLTADPMLNMRDVNQNAFTAFCSALSVESKENCIVVAVTAEKTVATVLRLSKFWLELAWLRRIVPTVICDDEKSARVGPWATHLCHQLRLRNGQIRAYVGQ